MIDIKTRLSFDFPRFVNVRRAYGPSFSPDGDRVAFIADLIGVPQAFSVSVMGGWPDQLTFTQDRVGMVSFSPTTDELVVATDVGGNEHIQLWKLSGMGETIETLTSDLDSMHPFGVWSPDGGAIAFASNERNGEDFDIYIHDFRSSTGRRVIERTGQWNAVAWLPNGTGLILQHSINSFDSNLYQLSLINGSIRELTAHTGNVLFEQAVVVDNGQALLLLSDRDTDTLSLARIDLTTLSQTTLLDLGWDIESISLAPDGQQLAYAVNIDGYSELFVVQLRSMQSRQIQMPSGVIGRGFVGNWRDGLTWSPSSRSVAFSLTTPRDTQNIWVADVPNGRAHRLTRATQAAIPSDELVKPKLIRYPTFDKRDIPAFVYAPAGAQPDGTRAAIVIIHGGPESQTRPGFDPTIQYYVHRGYVVMTPNVRGSTGYGKEYSHLDDIEKRMDSVSDACYAAEWLASSGWAHSKRIAVMGQSYGGFMVLACLCTDPDVWAAGVDLYGIANFVSFMENTHPFRRKHRAAEYGSLEEHRDVLERISPIRSVDRIVAPLFAVHGENDHRVPISETEQIVAALRERGIPTEFIRLTDEGHGLVRLSNRLLVYPAIAGFLDKHLAQASD